MCLPSPRARAADLAGIGLSFACLIHCLALPMVLLTAPALSRWLELPDAVHGAILLLALPAVAVAMSDGWRRHRRAAPVMTAIAGLAMLALGLAAHDGWIAVADREAADRLFTSIGAISLIAAHIINLRLRLRGTDHARNAH